MVPDLLPQRLNLLLHCRLAHGRILLKPFACIPPARHSLLFPGDILVSDQREGLNSGHEFCAVMRVCPYGKQWNPSLISSPEPASAAPASTARPHTPHSP